MLKICNLVIGDSINFTKNELLIRNELSKMLDAVELRLKDKKGMHETRIEETEFNQTSSQNLIEELQSLFLKTL